MMKKKIIFEKAFGKYLNPLFDYFWNELKITPCILFLILCIILYN
jgi:hypothetical protein